MPRNTIPIRKVKDMPKRFLNNENRMKRSTTNTRIRSNVIIGRQLMQQNPYSNPKQPR
jgi:hypothetical protein